MNQRTEEKPQRKSIKCGTKDYIISVFTMQPYPLRHQRWYLRKVASCFLSKQGTHARAGLELVCAALCSQSLNYIQPQSSSSIRSTHSLASKCIFPLSSNRCEALTYLIGGTRRVPGSPLERTPHSACLQSPSTPPAVPLGLSQHQPSGALRRVGVGELEGRGAQIAP